MWKVAFTVNGPMMHVGSFTNEVEAACAHDAFILDCDLNRPLNVASSSVGEKEKLAPAQGLVLKRRRVIMTSTGWGVWERKYGVKSSREL
tara:strand:- start:127 stop:396 length:270 start_codon:yes stop_codon:yes gene_type:complete